MINLNDLSDGNRICVFIRHGEKNLNDFSLTDNGIQDTITLANLLCTLKKTIEIYSSPEERCVKTATLINNVVNGNNQKIIISDVLGKPGIQVKDDIEYTKLTNVMKCRDIYKEWKEGLHEEAMNNPKDIKDKILTFFEDTSKKDTLTLYISQSGTVACTGYSLGLVDYKADDEDWVNYLDGYVLKLWQ